MSSLEKFLTKEATSFGRSILQSNAKKALKGLFGKFNKKTPETIAAEAMLKVGYPTAHYTVDKNQEPVFKSSTIFLHEWLTNAPETRGKLVRDEESGSCFYDGKPVSESKVALMNLFLKKTGANNSLAVSSNFDAALKLISVSNYTGELFKSTFRGWVPGSESVIDRFLPEVFEDALETDRVYASRLFRKWAIGTAKRAIHPGAPMDGCLTLTGIPGVGKTSFFRELIPAPFNNRTGEIMGSIKNPQKLVEAIVGKTICCFDELSALEAPKVQEVFKQILSSAAIDVRLPWRRDAQRFLLRNSFCATTNQERFIKDAALSRRLWTIKLGDKGRINFDRLNSLRHSLWQEAVYLSEVAGESYLLTHDEQKELETHNSQFEVSNDRK